MTSAFLPLFYIICLTNGMIIRQNVIFEQSHDISTTRRRWLVTMVIDLSIYDQSIDEFYNSLDEIIKVKNVLIKYYDVPLKDKYFRTFKELETEKLIYAPLKMLCISFQILNPLHDMIGYRRRRSLLPIIGKALIFLFRTVSESDLQGIRKNINNLANNQQ